MKELFLYVLYCPIDQETNYFVAKNDEELKRVARPLTSDTEEERVLITDTKIFMELYKNKIEMVDDVFYYGVVLKIPLSELPKYQGKDIQHELLKILGHGWIY